MSIQTFKRGATVPIWAEVKDWDGNLVSPDQGLKLTVTDPKGTVKVDAQAMTESATGKFVYHYNSQAADEQGWWPCSAKSQDGTAPAMYTITTGSFLLN